MIPRPHPLGPAVLALLLAVAGCAVVDGVRDAFRDRIDYRLPKQVQPLRSPASVYLARPFGAPLQELYDRNGGSLIDAFRHAFEAHGGRTVVGPAAGIGYREALDAARGASCDYLLMTRILRWEYGNAGFSGPGGRDDLDFDVLVADVATGLVLSRASIQISNGLGRSAPGGGNAADAAAPVVERYVGHLFDP